MIKVAKVKDIKENEGHLVQLPNGKKIALFKVKDNFYAIGDSCPHMGGSLSSGEVEEEVVACPWHGWCFSLKTGKCVNVPGEFTSCYKVVVKGQDIYLNDAKEN